MTAADDVMGAAAWPSNAELVADVVRLGYLDPATDRVLDCTWGHGVWWKIVHPVDLTACDLDGTKSPLGCPICETGADHPMVKRRPVHDGQPVDFRAMPWAADMFDVVAYDPPYVPVGSDETSTLQDYNQRYGRHTVPNDPEKLQAIIDAGLADVYRVLRRGGRGLVKCASYNWSGHLYPGAHHTLTAALNIGFELVDWFIHEGKWRPQPERDRKCGQCKGTCRASGLRGTVDGDRCGACGGSGREPSEQQHARQNLSHLYVLGKPKLRRGETGHPSLFDVDPEPLAP